LKIYFRWILKKPISHVLNIVNVTIWNGRCGDSKNMVRLRRGLLPYGRKTFRPEI